MFRNFTSPVYVRQVSGSARRMRKRISPEQSFMSVGSPDVDVTMMDVDTEGNCTFRLNGRIGGEQEVSVKIGNRSTDVKVGPFGIVTERVK